MAATYWSGKFGKLTLSGVSYAAQKFTVAIETTPVDVTNFNSPFGWREFITGFSKGTVDADCVFDSSLPQVTQGAAISFVGTLGTNNNSIICQAVIVGYTYGQDVNGNATLKIKANLTGAPSIVFT